MAGAASFLAGAASFLAGAAAAGGFLGGRCGGLTLSRSLLGDRRDFGWKGSSLRFLLDRCGSGGGDGGDGEVPLGNRRLGAFGQFHLGDVDRLADVKAGQVDDDLLGDIVGRAKELDLVADDIENAARLEARRGFMVAEMDRHLDADTSILAEPQEIDMDNEIPHGLELDVARNDAKGFPAEVEIDEGCRETAGADMGEQVSIAQGNERGFLLVAVDDGRNEALATNGTGGPLACPVACLGLQGNSFSHGKLLKLS